MFLHKHFGQGESTELEDVVRNLRHVLQAKRGCGYFRESFGVSDVGYRTPEEMVTALTAEIRENVRLYEPRVEVVGVDEEYDDDGRRVRLVVDARLRSADEALRIVFDFGQGALDVVPVRKPVRG